MKRDELNIFLADDHPFLLQGLSDYLIKEGYQIVGEANDGNSALDKICSIVPDLAILDIEMPGMTGFEVARLCKEKDLSTKFILLSYLKDPAVIVKVKEVNVLGYILKEDAMHELNRCIRTVMRGEYYLSKNVQNIDTKSTEKELNSLANLTPSEMKILKLIAQGFSNKEIASRLFVVERTVEKHRSNILSKLGVSKSSHSLNQWAILNKELINGR